MHAAINEIKEVNKFINDRKRKAERLHKLLQIQSKVYGNKYPLFQADSDREFLSQSSMEISISKKSKTRFILLFNDSLLITKKKKFGSQNLHFRFRFNFSKMKITIPNDTSIQLSERGIVIVIVTNKEKNGDFFEQMKKAIVSFTNNPQIK